MVRPEALVISAAALIGKAVLLFNSVGGEGGCWWSPPG